MKTKWEISVNNNHMEFSTLWNTSFASLRIFLTGLIIDDNIRWYDLGKSTKPVNELPTSSEYTIPYPYHINTYVRKHIMISTYPTNTFFYSFSFSANECRRMVTCANTRLLDTFLYAYANRSSENKQRYSIWKDSGQSPFHKRCTNWKRMFMEHLHEEYKRRWASFKTAELFFKSELHKSILCRRMTEETKQELENM